MKTKTDLCLDILRSTNDGNKLASWQLKLVEDSINGFLNEKGLSLLNLVYEQILKNDYNYPSDVFFKLFVDKVSITDAERYITCDQTGYVYYKGQCIDHYTYPERDLPKDRVELYKKAQHIEKLGLPVNTTFMVWRWDWIEKLTADDPFFSFVTNFHSLYQKDNDFLFFTDNNKIVTYNTQTKEKKITPLESFAPEKGSYGYATKVLKFTHCCIGQKEHQGQIFAPIEKIKQFWKENDLPYDLFVIS